MKALAALLPASCAGTGSTCAPTGTVDELERLYRALSRVTWEENRRTARLMSAGFRKMSQMVVEEAAEVALQTVRKRTDTTIRKSNDLLYHLVIIWHELRVCSADVWAEMRYRAEIVGITEKLPKQHGRVTAVS